MVTTRDQILVRIERLLGDVADASHEPRFTSAASARRAWVTTGYWLLWVLCAGLYWQCNSSAAADAVWITPVVLWMTVFRVAPIPSVTGRLRHLSTVLAIGTFACMFLVCFRWWLDIAYAFRFSLDVLRVNDWSLLINHSAAALVVSLFLVTPLLTTLGARGSRPVCSMITAALLWNQCRFLLHPTHWGYNGIAHIVLLSESIAPPAVLYGVCWAAAVFGPGAFASIRRNTPRAVADYWAGRTPPWLPAAGYVLGLAGICALLGWEYGPASLSEVERDARFCFAWPSAVGLLYAVSVPLWHSVQRLPKSRAKSSRWVRTVVSAVAGVIGTITIFVVSPALGFVLPLVAEHALHSDWRVEILDDPAAVGVRGDIGYGLADALEEAIKKHPNLKTLHLYSYGGLTSEAVAAAEIVHQHGLDTYVMRECASACTLIFAAGRKRVLAHGGKLGFHASRGATSFDDASGQEKWEAERLADYGVDTDFIRKANRVPNEQIWYPTVQELQKARVVTATE
jgi:hypothetical protein